MTKEEKIIEAYGELWEKTNGNLNDDYSFDFVGNMSSYNLNGKFKIIFTGISIFRAIPFSLIGIEENNGWTKIESENDLPKEKSFYHWMNKKTGKITFMHFNPRITYRTLMRFSHYKKLETPEHPVY